MFAQTFTVVKRYVSAGLHPEPDGALADLLTELRAEFRAVNWTQAEEKEFILQQRVTAIVDDIVFKLKLGPRGRLGDCVRAEQSSVSADLGPQWAAKRLKPRFRQAFRSCQQSPPVPSVLRIPR